MPCVFLPGEDTKIRDFPHVSWKTLTLYFRAEGQPLLDGVEAPSTFFDEEPYPGCLYE